MGKGGGELSVVTYWLMSECLFPIQLLLCDLWMFREKKNPDGGKRCYFLEKVSLENSTFTQL